MGLGTADSIKRRRKVTSQKSPRGKRGKKPAKPAAKKKAAKDSNRKKRPAKAKKTAKRKAAKKQAKKTPKKKPSKAKPKVVAKHRKAKKKPVKRRKKVTSEKSPGKSPKKKVTSQPPSVGWRKRRKSPVKLPKRPRKRPVKRKPPSPRKVATERYDELGGIVANVCEALSDEYPCESSIYKDKQGTIDAEVTLRGPFDEYSAEDALVMLRDAIAWKAGQGYWASIAFWIVLHTEQLAQRYEGPLKGLAPVATHPTKDLGIALLTARMNVLPSIGSYRISRITARFNWSKGGAQPERL